MQRAHTTIPGPLPLLLLLMALSLALCACASSKAGLKSPELPARHWLEEAPGVPVENKAKLEAAVPNLYDPSKVFSFEDCVFLTIQQSPLLVNSAVELEIKRVALTNAVCEVPARTAYDPYRVQQPHPL